MRYLVLSLIAAGLALQAGCASKCGPSNCGGCCASDGKCNVFSPSACGQSGGVCIACGAGQVCDEGVCSIDESTSATTSGSTSGTTSGSTGTVASSASVSSTAATVSSSTVTSTSGSIGTTGGPSGTTGSVTAATSVTTSSSGSPTASASTTSSSSTSSSGSGTNSGSTTSSGSTSSSGSSSGSACTVGALRCTANNGDLTQDRQTCVPDGGSIDSTPCTGSSYCGTDRATQGSCVDPCTAAVSNQSDLGCDYWGAVLSNSNLASPFTGDSANGSAGTTPSGFAFVVVNPLPQLAHVTVQQSGLRDVDVTVSAGSTASIALPWRMICGTGLATYGYHLTSDSPVTVYQFNPLPSSQEDDSCYAACPDGGFDTCGTTACTCPGGSCTNTLDTCSAGICLTYSYTNDASLLVPTALLGTSYVTLASSQISEGSTGTVSDEALPGMIAIIATANSTQVQVQFAGTTDSTAESTANSFGSAPICGVASGNLNAQSAGSTEIFNLNAGEVLQFWSANVGTPTCQASINGDTVCLYPNDLTGTIVTSLPSGSTPALPIAVFGGSDCTYVPWDQVACDHLEEEMTPYSTWGQHFASPKSIAYAGATQAYPDVYRIVSGCGTSCPSGTTVTISPALLSWNGSSRVSCITTGSTSTCTLPSVSTGTAPWLQFTHATDFTADADQPVTLAKYFVSQSAAGESGDQAAATEGDPALVLLTPIEQWRTTYSVLAPTTYLDNYIAVAVTSEAATLGVEVDGAAIAAGTWINVAGSSDYVATLHVCGSAEAATCSGVHTITSAEPLGATVYGYDSYVAYSYPGGQNLLPLNSGAVGQ